MLRHIELEPSSAYEAAALALPTHAILPVAPNDELQTPNLPREHPAWAADTLTLSSRARAIVAQLVPVLIRVLSFWDHRTRSATIGTRRLAIDAAGGYRLEP